MAARRARAFCIMRRKSLLEFDLCRAMAVLVDSGIWVSWAVILWDRSPPENLSTIAGMFLECIVYSLALWGLGALVTSQLAQLSISQRTMQAIALMGSGIFEEIIFRLLGFGLLL